MTKKCIISSHVVFNERVFPENTKTLTNLFGNLFPLLSDFLDPSMLPDQGGDSNLDDDDLPPLENPPAQILYLLQVHLLQHHLSLLTLQHLLAHYLVDLSQNYHYHHHHHFLQT